MQTDQKSVPDPYADAIKRAKEWLGRRYLLATPARKSVTPGSYRAKQ
jgi:hypothetical protein